jgi:hypothetical protein
MIASQMPYVTAGRHCTLPTSRLQLTISLISMGVGIIAACVGWSHPSQMSSLLLAPLMMTLTLIQGIWAASQMPGGMPADDETLTARDWIVVAALWLVGAGGAAFGLLGLWI